MIQQTDISVEEAADRLGKLNRHYQLGFDLRHWPDHITQWEWTCYIGGDEAIDRNDSTMFKSLLLRGVIEMAEIHVKYGRGIPPLAAIAKQMPTTATLGRATRKRKGGSNRRSRAAGR